MVNIRGKSMNMALWLILLLLISPIYAAEEDLPQETPEEAAMRYDAEIQAESKAVFDALVNRMQILEGQPLGEVQVPDANDN
ncbi:MAG: hypothetical protein ACRD98_00625 [Nitrososphaera sp.]